MKKSFFIYLIIIVMVLSTFFLLVACNDLHLAHQINDRIDDTKIGDGSKTNLDNTQNNQEGTTNSNQQLLLTASMLSSEKNLFVPTISKSSSNPYNIIDCYRDDRNYYYCFNLGRLKSVPVDKSKKSISYEMSQISVKRIYTKSTVTSTSIETESSRIEQRLVYDNNLAGWNFSIEEEVGIFEKFNEKIAVSAGVQYYQNTTMTSTTDITSTTKEETVTESETIEMTFDSSCPTGKYRICNVMDFDIFVFLKKNIYSGVYEIAFNAKPLSEIVEKFEYTADSFNDVSLSDIQFDESIIPLLPTPTKTFKDPNQNTFTPQTYYINTQALSCKLDNKYNYDKPDPNGNNIHYSHDFEFGKFIIKNVEKVNEGDTDYIKSPNSDTSVTFRINYDCSNLPVQDNMKSRYVSTDSRQSGFYKLPFDVGERDIKKGMLVVRISYEDGSPDEKICKTNIFDGKKSGDEIDIVLNIAKACKIEIAICYELVMWAPGFLGIVDDYWMNWRINQTFVIK